MADEDLNDDNNEGLMDSGVSEESFTAPVLHKFQTAREQQKWLKELQASRRNRKTFDEEAVKTIQRYSGKQDADGQYSFPSSTYNLFFSNIELFKAQLFVRTPEPDVKRRFDDAQDDISRVAADRLQRNLAYELDCEGRFAANFENIIFDRLVAGFGAGWARLDEELTEPQQQPKTELVPVPTLDPATGQMVTEMREQAVLGDDGQPVMEDIPGSEIAYQFAELDYVAWDDLLWAPCTVWTDCRWVARRIPMNKKDTYSRFSATAGKEVLANLAFEEVKSDSSSDEQDRSRQLKPKHTVEKTCDIYEIWDKATKHVFWITDGADIPLDVRKDTTAFPGFFPTPLPPLGRFNTSATKFISDYSQVRGLYLQLDDLQERITSLTDALQLRWVYDASYKPLRDLYSTTGGLQGIPVEDWLVQMEKGGLKGALEFAPLQEIATTYQALLAAQETVKAKIFEIEGISDLMRGQSQAYDSSQATAAKAQFGTSKLDLIQRQVAKYAERLTQLKAHLICKFYKPEYILERSGPVSAADQQFIEPAMQLLKDAPMMHWRINVSVDSIQDPNWNMERASRVAMVQAVSAGMAQILPIAESNPVAAELGAQLMQFALAGFKGASEVEGWVDQAMERMRAQAGQQAPKPPTDAQVKAQAEIQKATISAQTDLQKTQMQNEADMRVAQLEAQKDILNAQLKARDLDLQAAELRLKAAGLM